MIEFFDGLLRYSSKFSPITVSVSCDVTSEDMTNLRFSSISRACNFIKKETLAQVFSCEFCKVSTNTYFTGHLLATASVGSIDICLYQLKEKQRICEAAASFVTERPAAYI